ncbi:MAG: HAMP domain-containing histidine kinase [Planctomycetaceae bacterium]|nr:HAMP domain-containing histidine kinase [Planctomycetaceae bacterium]
MKVVRFGFGARVALAFSALGLLLVALGVEVSRSVGDINVEVRRVTEEHREEAFSRDILHEMTMFKGRIESLGGARPTNEQREAFRAFLLEAERCVVELESGPIGDDPSREEHIESESRLMEALRDDLEALGRAVDTNSPELGELVEVARRHAWVLNEEMREESRKTGTAMREEARRVRAAVLAMTAVALAVLALLSWMFWRSVVRPVQELRAGVKRISGGDLGHRVPVHSSDEVGELAREFNHMSDELHGMRTGLEQRVEERTREFVRAARLAGLGTMAAGIAHEINNPLASIASCAEGLERRLSKGTVDAETQREYLGIIAREAYRAHEITSRLLDFARTESGARVSFGAEALMRELRVLLEHRLRSRQLELDVQIEPELPQLSGNPTEVKQVLLNLIHNAIDASPAGGRVSVRWTQANGDVRIEVEDQGPGIPADIRERIFDPFFTTKEPGSGTGLGLAIVHRIVTAHSGRIEVLDTGHGALFRIQLPLHTP